jgi:hypothetical protein
MPYYFYVKSGGTGTAATAKFAAPKTGSWSTAFTNTNQYYDSLFAITDELSYSGFSANDVIFVSDEHNFTYTTNPLNVYGIEVDYYSSNTVRVISVDDDDITVPSPGATESYNNENTTVSFSLTFGAGYNYGIILNILGNTSVGLNGPLFDTCQFNIEENTPAQKSIGTTVGCTFVDCVFNLGTVLTSYTTTFYNEYEFTNIFRNCTFIAPESTEIPLIRTPVGGAVYGSARSTFEGCDFTQCNRPFYTSVAKASKSLNRLLFIGCKEAPNNRLDWKLQGGVWEPSGFVRSGIYNNLEFLYYETATVLLSSSIYRTDGSMYEFNKYFSKEITTLDLLNTNTNNQFYFKLADLYTDTTNSTTFTVEIAQDNAVTVLSNQDIVLEVRYPNANSNKGNVEFSSNILFMESSILDSSVTDLPTSSKTWVGLTNPTKQYLSVTTSETGFYGLCSIYLKIFKSNITLYVCPKVDIT